MIERLSRGPASVSELASRSNVVACGLQHLQVLEASGLVESQNGRVRACQIVLRLSMAERWINDQGRSGSATLIVSANTCNSDVGRGGNEMSLPFVFSTAFARRTPPGRLIQSRRIRVLCRDNRKGCSTDQVVKP
jgi:hypothetical protein